MNIDPDVVGIDVSKHTLDVFDSASGRSERVANTPGPLGDLAKRLASRFVVLEATGRYDGQLRRTLQAAGVAYARVSPSQARDFARAAGFLAKTDRVDARMLARLGQALRPAPAEPIDEARERLAALHKRRDQLIAFRQQERTRRMEIGDEPDLLDDIDRHLDWLEAEINAFDKRIAQAVAATPVLQETERRLRSLPGIGPVGAATLLALLPELGQRSPKSIAALAGLAPFNRDSGQFRGQRTIRGGRRRVRQALYMAAVAASRSHSRFAATYQGLRAAGKPAKLAFIALARRILVTANAMVRDHQAFIA